MSKKSVRHFLNVLIALAVGVAGAWLMIVWINDDDVDMRRTQGELDEALAEAATHEQWHHAWATFVDTESSFREAILLLVEAAQSSSGGGSGASGSGSGGGGGGSGTTNPLRGLQGEAARYEELERALQPVCPLAADAAYDTAEIMGSVLQHRGEAAVTNALVAEAADRFHVVLRELRQCDADRLEAEIAATDQS